jgi:tRNA(His) 5'-end guanylyltransferase
MGVMQTTMLELCKQIQTCYLGYTQSDEITLLLADFANRDTEAWFDGNLNKILSISASIATAEFNKAWQAMQIEKYLQDVPADQLRFFGIAESIKGLIARLPVGHFDSRAYSLADPWEAYNSFLWRQQDASKNSIQMVAQALYPKAERGALHGKNTAQLHDLIHIKGQNWNDYPVDCKRGSFCYNTPENGWIVDVEGPILTQDKGYFFSKIPSIKQFETVNVE